MDLTIYNSRISNFNKRIIAHWNRILTITISDIMTDVISLVETKNAITNISDQILLSKRSLTSIMDKLSEDEYIKYEKIHMDLEDRFYNLLDKINIIEKILDNLILLNNNTMQENQSILKSLDINELLEHEYSYAYI